MLVEVEFPNEKHIHSQPSLVLPPENISTALPRGPAGKF